MYQVEEQEKTWESYDESPIPFSGAFLNILAPLLVVEDHVPVNSSRFLTPLLITMSLASHSHPHVLVVEKGCKKDSVLPFKKFVYVQSSFMSTCICKKGTTDKHDAAKYPYGQGCR